MLIKILYFMIIFTMIYKEASAMDKSTQSTSSLRPTNGPVQILCLSCLCDGITNCSTLLTREADAEGKRGPFRITREYWTEGGRPLMPGDDCKDENTAFGNCVMEVYCAARAVQGYMAKYEMDCTGDDIIDCDDYAAIHIQGPNNCRREIKHENFLKRYPKCKSMISKSSKIYRN